MKSLWRNLTANPQSRRRLRVPAYPCGELLELRQLLTVYAIDPVMGSDSNPGTLEEPFRTPVHLSWGAPSYRALEAGDVVYLRDGVHDWSDIIPSVDEERENAAFLIRGVQGTLAEPITIRAYPGERPIVTARKSGTENSAIYVQQSEFVNVIGLEVTGTYGPGIRVAEATNIEIAHNYVHDVDGNHDNNIAGIYTQDTIGLEIHHNLLHDNYDRARAETPGIVQRANSRNIVIFGDGSDDVVVHHNKVFNTPRADGRETGAGIWVKHASQIPDASFEFYDNIVRDVQFSAIGSQSVNGYLHHNLIVNASPFQGSGGDNITFVGPHVSEYNTFAGSRAFEIYGAPGLFPASGFLEFRNNIVVDDEPFYGVDHGIIRLAPYGSDADYRVAVTPQNLTFSGNVYYNALTAPMWNVFAADVADDGEVAVLGGNLSFVEWQALGVDGDSVVANPLLDAAFIPANSVAKDAGWLASETPRLAMYVGQDLFRESAGPNASSVTIVRAGMSLSQPLTVTLTTSDASEIQVPSTVTFPVGVSVLQVPITAIDDNLSEPTRAVQIFASASPGLQSSEWVRVLQEGETPIEGAGNIQFAIASQTVNEAAGTLAVTVTRQDGSVGEIDVSFTTISGTATSNSDFVAQTGQIHFNQGEVSKTITIAITEDILSEASETFQVELTSVTGGATLGIQNRTTITITDNDAGAPARVFNTRPVQGKRKIKQVEIQFDSPMLSNVVDRTSAYQLLDAGRDGQFGTRGDRKIKVNSVSYNEQTRTATILMSRGVKKGRRLQIVIPTNTLYGQNQLSLDGDNNGQPGGQFQDEFSV